MALAYSLPSDLAPSTVQNTASFLRILALTFISGAAIASRLFAVINFESIIHELYVPLPLGSIGADADVVSLAIHGLISTFLQGRSRSATMLKVVGSRATMVLASKGFYVCPAPTSRICRVLKTVLGILELVRPNSVVPTRSCGWWYNLPRSDGHERCHLQRPPRFELTRRYSKRLRAPCPRI